MASKSIVLKGIAPAGIRAGYPIAILSTQADKSGKIPTKGSKKPRNAG